MAARENQGLQIALIIFVMLTIVLIVTTYMFFRSFSDERDKAKALTQQNSDMDSKMREAIDESSNYKALITSAQDESLDALREASKKELETLGEGLPESEQNYRGLVNRMAANLRKAEATNAELAAKVQELNDQLKTNGEAAQAQANQYTDQLTKTAADLENERKTFGADRSRITAEKEKQAASFTAARTQDVQFLQKSKEQMAAMTGELARTEKLLDDLRNKEARQQKANEYPDGKVTRVSQRSRSVWLDVGRADGLRRQTSFVVVAPEDGNPIESEPKGRIEVIKLTGAHQAEARIVEDDLSNPIMPGDNVFSVVWDAGRPEHFALAGVMDIDGDGEGDSGRIRDLIALSGGIVDAEVTDDGTRSGQMSINTKYLVLGRTPRRPQQKPRSLLRDHRRSRDAGHQDHRHLGLRQIPGLQSRAPGGHAGQVRQAQRLQAAPAQRHAAHSARQHPVRGFAPPARPRYRAVALTRSP